MNTLKLTSQFKKDLKRYKHKPEVIWWNRDAGVIKLVRFGTHSELF